MDDLAERLSSVLSDPQSMERIRSMAENLLSEEKPKEQSDSLFPDIDMGKLLPLISKINVKRQDKRTQLLLALRPHLSEKRQERVDTAVKILRVIDMLPLLSESGLFNL